MTHSPPPETDNQTMSDLQKEALAHNAALEASLNNTTIVKPIGSNGSAYFGRLLPSSEKLVDKPANQK